MPTARASSLYQNLLAGTYADGTAFESALTDSATRGAWRELVGSCTEMLKAFTADTNATNILEDVIMASQTARRDAASGPAANEAWAASWAYVTAVLADTTAMGYLMDDPKCLVHWAIQSGRTLAALIDDSDTLTVMGTELRRKNMAQALLHPLSKLTMSAYTVSGTYAGPAGAIWIKAMICGGGGGGSQNSASAGAGGGGGQLRIAKAIYGAIAAALVITVGAGGAGSSGAASAGGTSSVIGLASASGGGGASSTSAGTGGTSGTPSGSWASDLDPLLLNLGLVGLVFAASVNLAGGNGGAGAGFANGGGGGGGLGGGNGGAAHAAAMITANAGGGGGRGQNGAAGGSGGGGAGGGGGATTGPTTGGGSQSGPTYGDSAALGFGGGSGGQTGGANSGVAGGFPGGGASGGTGNPGGTGGAGYVLIMAIRP